MIAWEWRGLVPYERALALQREQRDAILEGRAPEVLWALEHEPVITTGRRAVDDLPSATELAERGIALARTERGGLATAHNPGQLVVYVFVDAARRRLGVRGLVHALEAAVIGWLGELDVVAHRRPDAPGVWVGRDKICALGLHFRRGVSMHGLALNLTNDLGIFELITPCGIRDGGVTRLADHLPTAPPPSRAAQTLVPAICAALVGQDGS